MRPRWPAGYPWLVDLEDMAQWAHAVKQPAASQARRLLADDPSKRRRPRAHRRARPPGICPHAPLRGHLPAGSERSAAAVATARAIPLSPRNGCSPGRTGRHPPRGVGGEFVDARRLPGACVPRAHTTNPSISLSKTYRRPLPGLLHLLVRSVLSRRPLRTGGHPTRRPRQRPYPGTHPRGVPAARRTRHGDRPYGNTRFQRTGAGALREQRVHAHWPAANIHQTPRRAGVTPATAGAPAGSMF